MDQYGVGDMEENIAHQFYQESYQQVKFWS